MAKPVVYIRADGNSEIGLGHVIRSLALAGMLKEDFRCIFATRFLTDYINTEARKVCDEVIKLPETEEHFDAFLSILSGDEIVVLDNYFFDTEYQKAIRNKSCKLVCIDDIHDKHFVADVVINHAGGFSKEFYSVAPYTCLFLGTDYALLRPEFLNRDEKGDNSSLLLCLGGADKDNVTLQIVKLLEHKQFPHKCYVVVGDAFQYQQDLIEFQHSSKLNIEVFKNLSARQMADVMSECRYAICPPSTVSYEYLSKKGGELYLKIIADNQKDIYAFFIKNEIAFDISELFVNEQPKIKRTLETQRKYFDGQSGKRIKVIFRRLKNEQQLKLRKARLSDLDLYFQWVNDLDARQNATSVKPILYNDHCEWFSKKIISKDAYLWVLERDETPIGQIRFDIDRHKKEATISYLIAQEYRGQGIGLSIVKMGLELFFMEEKNISIIIAVVKLTNEASRKIFEHLGFRISTEGNGFLYYIKG